VATLPPGICSGVHWIVTRSRAVNKPLTTDNRQLTFKLPVIAIYLFFLHQITDGVTAGSTKG
jgi:ABC-type maltose transport system permease subunit